VHLRGEERRGERRGERRRKKKQNKPAPCIIEEKAMCI